jgi:hypothetical protein
MTEIHDNDFAIARLHIDNYPAVIGDFFAGDGLESDLKADRPDRSTAIRMEHEGVESIGLRFLNRRDNHRGLKVNARSEGDLLATEQCADQQHKEYGCYDPHGLNLSHLDCVI